MVSIPMRIDVLSAIQPIIGNIAKPGIIHSEATEKPVARARGGMANDKTAKVAGPRTASDAEMAQFTATAM